MKTRVDHGWHPFMALGCSHGSIASRPPMGPSGAIGGNRGPCMAHTHFQCLVLYFYISSRNLILKILLKKELRSSLFLLKLITRKKSKNSSNLKISWNHLYMIRITPQHRLIPTFYLSWYQAHNMQVTDSEDVLIVWILCVLLELTYWLTKWTNNRKSMIQKK